jgi:histidyl-tRNA synthetase
MTLSTIPYKGARDFYPYDKKIQNWIFNSWRRTCVSFGFQEYDGPLIEPFEMYAAKTGDEIVNTQLYSFVDRGDRKVAIRPEMTPTLARMVAGKIQEIPKPIRWFSMPNLWRYEKPQKGRLREHWQLNVDVLGGETQFADIEIVRLALDLFEKVGARNKVTIHLNNRRLMDQLFLKELRLSEAAAYQVSKAIDSYSKISKEEFSSWLAKIGLSGDQIKTLNTFLTSDLGSVSRILIGEGFTELCHLMEGLSQFSEIKFDPTIMRGMDYYTGNVFEAFDTHPDNRRALFGGGRYDNLVGLFSKTQLSGVGFGLGDVTFHDFLAIHNILPTFETWVDVFVTIPSQEKSPLAQNIASQLRALGFSVMTPLSVDGFGAQLKMASKHKCGFAVILGDEELKKGEVQVKNLSSGKQESVKQSEVGEFLKMSSTRT